MVMVTLHSVVSRICLPIISLLVSLLTVVLSIEFFAEKSVLIPLRLHQIPTKETTGS